MKRMFTTRSPADVGSGRLIAFDLMGMVRCAAVAAAALSIVSTPAAALVSTGGGFEGSEDHGSYNGNGGGGTLGTAWFNSSVHTGFFATDAYTNRWYGDGVGQATFGRLKSDIHARADNPLGDGTMSAMNTSLYFTDHLTVLSAGQLKFSLSLADALSISPGAAGNCAVANIPLNGTYSSNSCALAAAEFKINADEPRETWLRLEDSTTPGGNGVGVDPSITIAVTAGESIDIGGYFRLSAIACTATGRFARYPAAGCVGGVTGLAAASGQADFFVDSLGGAAFGSDSGFGYGSPSAAVPEPVGWSVLLAGFGISGAMLRRRRIGAPFAA